MTLPTASGERTSPFTPLVHLWLAVVALAWFTLSSALQGEPWWNDLGNLPTLLSGLPWWSYLVVAGLVAGLLVGYWSWWTTRFFVDATEFRIENTGAFKESKRIAFSRIQSVDLTQPFAARLVGLAQLRIDVGADAPTTLQFLTRRRAAELRAYLMVRAHGRTASPVDTVAADVPGAATASAWDDATVGDEVLIRLGPGDLALGAFLSTELLGLLSLFVVPLGLSVWFGAPGMVVGVGLVPLAFTLLGYFSKRLFDQYNYTLARTSAGLRVTRGLFTLKSQTIPAHRVQSITITQPLPWRWLRRSRLDVVILGGGGQGDADDLGARTNLLPIGDGEQVRTALAAVWPGLRQDDLVFTPSPRRARWLDPLAWRWQGWAVDEHVVVARRGALTRTEAIVPHARLQSARLRQGPWERRLGLADVQLHTTNALSRDSLAHVDADVARVFVFDALERARAARTDELLRPSR